MKISDASIDQVRDCQISSVIGHYIPLKKSGSNYLASCPFHNEKSASFSVNDTKAIYKCFGCGRSGNVIGFVMEHHNQTFVEAVKTIASLENIQLDLEEFEQSEAEKEKATCADLQEKTLNYIIPIFQKKLHLLPSNHPAKLWLESRGYGQEICDQWQIGWSPNEFRDTTPDLVNKGFFDPSLKLGLIRKSKIGDSYYDVFRSRLIFPIKDKNGRFIGLGGRYIKIDNNDAAEVPPKYINTSDCELYNKSTVLYGFFSAKKSIEKMGFAAVVEGYCDTISPHKIGLTNTVAACGISLTKQQITLLKRYTKRVSLWRDNDEAGIKSTINSIPILVREGFHVEVVLYEGKDPDEWAQKGKDVKSTKFPPTIDAVLWLIDKYWKEADSVPELKAAKDKSYDVISNIKEESLRNDYLNVFIKKYKLKSNEVKKAFKNFVQNKEDEQSKKLKKEDKPGLNFYSQGNLKELGEESGLYVDENNQYYSKVQIGEKFIYKCFSNFTIEIKAHMRNGFRPKRALKITNNRGRQILLDVDTDKLSSRSEAKKFFEGLGNFRFTGSESQLDLLKAYLFEQEVECQEIATLGWQEDGFWAWSNGVFIDKYVPLDESGFITVNGKSFYIPAGNRQQPNRLRKYSNELKFKHFHEHNTFFAEWAHRHYSVFKNIGIISQLFTLSCVFSDIVFNIKNFFPILFIQGAGGSGKGSSIKMAQRLFGIPQDPLTLSGKANTDKAKIAITAQFVNAMILLEEYNVVHEIDQMLKNMWDRYGYKRRTMDNGYGTEDVPINSGVAVTGNYTPIDDPTMQRFIYVVSDHNAHTQQEKDLFNELQLFNEKGLTSVLHDILIFRKQVERNYREVHEEMVRCLTKEFGNLSVTSRMIENISVLLSIFKILQSNGLVFPYSFYTAKNLLITNTKIQNEKRDSSSDVQKFFDVLLHLIINGKVVMNREFKYDGEHLYMYFKQVHGFYLEAHRSMFGLPGLSSRNMLDKLKIHSSYKETVDSCRIGSGRTSAVVFDHRKIGIDIIGSTGIYPS